ncbi:MAG TPA: spore coat protein U domain-containing protein [Candidatus Baltobacteraceae bacterium]|nr:spore coat protein U domain-containing protein [Candidatus Baltobacteraceae bacterium]
MFKRFGTLSAALALAVAASAGTAMATSNTQGLTVTGSVGQSCTTLSSAQTLQFSAYDFQTNATAADTAGPVSYTTSCTKGSSVAFSVNGGANYAHTSGTRAMKSSSTSDYLNYGLFQNSNDTTAWGFDSGTGAGTNGPTLNPTSKTQVLTLTIYGSIPGGQDVSVATDYTDAVTVAINY